MGALLTKIFQWKWLFWLLKGFLNPKHDIEDETNISGVGPSFKWGLQKIVGELGTRKSKHSNRRYVYTFSFNSL